jgi:hypothetical protein
MDQQPQPRAGKYCPRCHAMTQRDQAVCGQCGHQFRTGGACDTQNEPDTQAGEPDLLHRTMQFTLPPLAPRPAAPVELAPPTNPVARPRGTIFAALALLALCLAAVFWHIRSRPAPEAASPVGIWETTLHGKASANAHLEFALNSGGTGRFSWRESGPAALSGQTPLQWRQDTGGNLTLLLDKPAAGDLVSQTLVGIFSSHPWPWRVDRTRRELVLGTLVFTEKP